MIRNNEAFLLLRGYLAHDRSGWWHPPSCLANFPENDAMRMASKERPLSLDELREYYRDVGMFTEPDEAYYQLLCESAAAE